MRHFAMSESKLSREVSPERNVSKHDVNGQHDGGDSFESRGEDTSSTTCDEASSYRTNKNAKPGESARMEQSRNEGTKTLNQEENFKQTNMRNIQSAMAVQDAFMRSGYDAMQTYYSWLPGIAPMRFPAFFYPPPFIGFPPNAALAKNNATSDSSNQEELEKEFYHEEPNGCIKPDTKTSELTNKNNNNKCCDLPLESKGLADSFEKDHNRVFHSDVVSDVDEGMVLEDNDSEASDGNLKRRRPYEQEKYQCEERRVATVSVIQENCSIRKEIRDTNDDTDSEEQDENAKRGRASTRQIEKTEQYWDRRKKNNVSAKKSRDARRQREIMTNQRSAMLETESLRLRAEVATLREENERLKKQLSNLKSS